MRRCNEFLIIRISLDCVWIFKRLLLNLRAQWAQLNLFAWRIIRLIFNFYSIIQQRSMVILFYCLPQSSSFSAITDPFCPVRFSFWLQFRFYLSASSIVIQLVELEIMNELLDVRKILDWFPCIVLFIPTQPFDFILGLIGIWIYSLALDTLYNVATLRDYELFAHLQSCYQLMKNILQYLWQTDRIVQSQKDNVNAVLGLWNCLAVDEKFKLRWYFYSAKQCKTLKKKAENTSVDLFLKNLQQKRANGYAGICILFNQNKIEKLIISNTELVQLTSKPTQPFIFVDLSWIKKTSFFNVNYENSQVNVSQINIPEFSEITNQIKNPELAISTIIPTTLSFIKAIEQNLTMGKSAIKKLKLMVAWNIQNNQAFISLLWGDILTLTNDYYNLGFTYQQQGFIIKQAIEEKIIQEEEWECEGCLSELTNKNGVKQVCQEDIIFIRSELGVSKYGIVGKQSFEICKDCVQILRNK